MAVIYIFKGYGADWLKNHLLFSEDGGTGVHYMGYREQKSYGIFPEEELNTEYLPLIRKKLPGDNI